MNCAEVMEWMHRYLDQDLSRDEIVEMFLHIDDCPSCAEVFGQLTFLSKELEQLPDVKPPFSLVDSILPQLAELDHSSREQSAVRSEEPVVVPFSRESARGKASKGASVATRTGIGAIAAAVLLGVAIFNMPDKMPGADVEQMLQDSATPASGDASNMIEARTFNIESNASSVDNGSDLGAGQDIEATPDAVQDNPALDRVMEPTESASMTTAPTNEPNARSSELSIPQPTDNVKPKPTKKPEKPKPDVVTKAQTPNPSNASDSQSKVDKKEQMADIESSDAGGAMSSSLLMQDSPETSYDDYVHGVNLDSAKDSKLQTWTSPDGLYTVEVAGLQLVIYKNSPKGAVEGGSPVTSYSLEGNWVSGEWLADSSQFTYVTEEAGINITKVYTVQEAGITSSTPAVSPVPTPENTPSTSSTNLK
jgi:hypothetical protein